MYFLPNYHLTQLKLLDKVIDLKRHLKFSEKERREILITLKKENTIVEINHCREACPFFHKDGGPDNLLICKHPRLTGAWCGCGIIKPPDCDTGFPEKCPLLIFVSGWDVIERNRREIPNYDDRDM